MEADNQNRRISIGEVAAAVSIFVAVVGFLYYFTSVQIDSKVRSTLEERLADIATITSRQLADNDSFSQQIASKVMTLPVGCILAYPGEVEGDGLAGIWLPCDGRAMKKSEFPALFEAIGTVNGDGGYGFDFNIPDMRGRFLRGVDDGIGRDPEAFLRKHPIHVEKARQDGYDFRGNEKGVGSIQDFATWLPELDFETDSKGLHTHTIPLKIQDHNFALEHRRDGQHYQWKGTTGTSENGGHTHTVKIHGGAKETRPLNLAVHWIIRVK